MRRAALAVSLIVALQVSADCLTPQWTRQSISTGTLRIGDTVVADFDGDGQREIAALAQTSSGQPWTRIVKSSALAAPTTVHTGNNIVAQLFAADANGDNRADLIFAEATSKTIVVLTGRSNGTFNSPITTTLNGTPAALTVAHMDGDGRIDVVVYESTLQNVLVLKGDGAGRFTQVEQLPFGDTVHMMTSADFNGDGALDIALSHPEFDEFTLLFGLGNGTFGAGAALESGDWPAGMAAGDLNGDNRPDLVTADVSDGRITVYINDDGEAFKTPVRYTPNGLPNSVVLADLTGDNKLDIAVGTQSGNSVDTFTNNGDGTFSHEVNTTCTACSTAGISAGDVNGDGRVDLVSGASGLSVYTNQCGMSVVELVARTPVINAFDTATVDVNVRSVTDQVPLPTGSISIREGEKQIAFGPINAQYTLHDLAVGTHTLTAHYNGNAEFEPSTSAAITVIVNPLASTTTITRSVESSVSGQPVAITATATSTRAPTAGITAINVRDLVRNSLSGQTFAGPRGTHTITPLVGTYEFDASFYGDPNYTQSASAKITHVVSKATPTVTAVPLFAAAVGQTAKFSARVLPPFTGTATGTVRLFEGSTLLATATLDASGVALLQTAALTEGTHQLHVTYDGDAEFNSAQSPSFSFTVTTSTPPRKRRAAGH